MDCTLKEGIVLTLAKFLGSFRNLPKPALQPPGDSPEAQKVLPGERAVFSFTLRLKNLADRLHTLSDRGHFGDGTFNELRQFLMDEANDRCLRRLEIKLAFDRVLTHPEEISEREFDELIAAMSDANVRPIHLYITDSDLEALTRKVHWHVLSRRLENLRTYRPPALSSYDELEQRFRTSLGEYGFTFDDFGSGELELKQLRIRAYRLDGAEALRRVRERDGDVAYWTGEVKSILTRGGLIPQEFDERITDEEIAALGLV